VAREKLCLCRSAAGQESVKIEASRARRSHGVAASINLGKPARAFISKKRTTAQSHCAAAFVDQNSAQKKPSFLALQLTRRFFVC
jgi:hypothetical protein